MFEKFFHRRVHSWHHMVDAWAVKHAIVSELAVVAGSSKVKGHISSVRGTDVHLEGFVGGERSGAFFAGKHGDDRRRVAGETRVRGYVDASHS